jgi:hypothetical protein
MSALGAWRSSPHHRHHHKRGAAPRGEPLPSLPGCFLRPLPAGTLYPEWSNRVGQPASPGAQRTELRALRCHQLKVARDFGLGWGFASLGLLQEPQIVG